MSKIKSPKKLIEVALPLDDINAASSAEKSIRHGHPSTLHMWWARRPLAASKAVLFAQLVNDPGGERGWQAGKTKEQADKEREELFEICRELIDWKNLNNKEVISKAREKIKQSWRETCKVVGGNPEVLPEFYDPFSGGGAIPLEAQRLGLESTAFDINPVAVSINKAMIEIPPRFRGKKPVGPITKEASQFEALQDWPGSQCLHEDVKRYGEWVKKEAESKIGYLYPKITLPEQFGGKEVNVISWIWARTVKSPNPAYSDIDVPLVSNFFLCTKKGKECYLVPEFDGSKITYKINYGLPENPEKIKKGTKAGRGSNFTCVISGVTISADYIKSAGKSGRIGQQLMAICAAGKQRRHYFEATKQDEDLALSCEVPEGIPEITLANDPRAMYTPLYGLKKFKDLYTNRQLVAITTLIGLIKEVKNKVIDDALKNGWSDNSTPLNVGGDGSLAYAEAITTYLSFAISKLVDINTNLCTWGAIQECPLHLFNRQAIPMVWDFAEANPLSDSSGSWSTVLSGVLKGMAKIVESDIEVISGKAIQRNAQFEGLPDNTYIISTDPPYYDNVPYANLSDYFYMWLRPALRDVFPSVFSTLSTPKDDELVANQYLKGGKKKAEEFFLTGMTKAMKNIASSALPQIPVTIYYAFKQSETKQKGTTSAGWETFLEAVISAGFVITGTWPIRTERGARMRGQESNALASSIVLVCRKKSRGSNDISRRQFQRELRESLPEALEIMIGGSTGASPIAPVDLAQAAIGPGMAIFSKYESVLNQDGSKMSVHEALIMINRAITDYLNPDSSNFDNDTLFCDDWFSQYGWGQGQFGEADTLARAKGTSVQDVHSAGVIESGGGKVRLLKWSEYPTDWDPKTDTRTPIWEACHQMIRVLNQQSEAAAGALLARMPERSEHIRQLAYHLYTQCERKKWAEEARAYNELIASWHAIIDASHVVGHRGSQLGLELDF
ncbi:DUF1156 domain-containing protein [Legionella pneumophila]|uniref:DUF1156 domain-containing protein n=1 Tax=Legionella pneumophila TaxID=446 RepID=UPI0022B40929|nr:DUF1156 domain-containing protein [Legionella pneumophila]MCZ4806713.1 DUF1156 domain-containing protein [Legionella pneumophila]